MSITILTCVELLCTVVLYTVCMHVSVLLLFTIIYVSCISICCCCCCFVVVIVCVIVYYVLL